MADPAPVAQTFFVDDDVTTYTTLDGIITVVDCKHIIQHLKNKNLKEPKMNVFSRLPLQIGLF